MAIVINSGKVADLLLNCLPEDREWGDDADITFTIPEHVAWEINELAQERGLLLGMLCTGAGLQAQ